MDILVSDTSVLIDLEHGGLLQVAFGCGLVFVVPDLLYQRELEENNGPYLRSLGLGVVELTPVEAAMAQDLRNAKRALSLQDCFALACATRPGHLLATGDQNLRKAALQMGVGVHGVLWLLRTLEQFGVPAAVLGPALIAIRDDPTCRLPADEVAALLQEWGF